MKSNMNLVIAVLLLSVFAVGTLNFVDTLEAASWKKYDSGTSRDEYPLVGYKKTSSYESYTKGTNELYVNIYAHPKDGTSKKLIQKINLKSNKDTVRISMRKYLYKEKINNYYTTEGWTVKQIYKKNIKENIRDIKTPPEKKASDKKSFSVNNDTFKVYGIKWNKEYIHAYIYKKGEVYSSFSLYYEYYGEYNNKIIQNKNVYREFDQKGKLVSMETFKKSQSLKSIYKTKINKLINKIKTQ